MNNINIDQIQEIFGGVQNIKTISILITAMADIISGEKVCMIMDAFNSLADRQGTVETRMLGALMKRLGENPSQEEVQDMINEVDSEGVGTIR